MTQNRDAPAGGIAPTVSDSPGFILTDAEGDAWRLSVGAAGNLTITRLAGDDPDHPNVRLWKEVRRVLRGLL
ncbi:MAG: hypothetical protein QM346_19490 [Chloroflexota bacterium]|nr:hypothetical protein [Chloroflexota bacterium]